MKQKDGELNATDGKTYAHLEDALADGRMTERARTVALVAAQIWATCTYEVKLADVITEAADIVTRADEWDRHERLQR